MSYQSKHLQIMDMRFSGQVSVEDFQRWLSQIETFFDKEQYFVLVMQSEPNTTFPEEYRQIQSVWYKRHKSKFYQYCIGLARLAQDEDDQVRLNSPALHAAWRVPYFVTQNHTEALQWAVQRWT